MLRVWRGEGCFVIYRLVASFKAEKRKVNMGDAWFRFLPLSLSFSQSSGLWTVVCLLLIWPRNREICLLYRFIYSDQIRLGFLWFFYCESHGLAKKILLIILIFWQISSTFCYALILCAETPFFHFEESLSTDNIRWILSWALVTIIILCVQ